ncbi:formamidopyrimidine-DNA glycosylase [Pedobacter psychrodurus]|uniref:Formamidopyrimidine-DNA glycosylase n=1 Tax=Pedobacter psychrodurus TaxID=2530456 RepID=A0A4R0PYN4_9SPHI|nr:DNA-formamidopyrimidine glycosylase family protein [Pedobacter psychrodurus]TCD26551.1 formamidopyrimidine-DNA glycosylase [Pedobacter psychrodurus]
MAELPDLTVFAQILERRYKGKTLATLEISVAKKINVPAKELRTALEGRELLHVKRVGKTLQLYFSGNQILGLHLMLRGELSAIENDEPSRFQIIGFHFEGGEGFAVIDMQKQATPTLNPNPVAVPDALEITEKEFLKLLSGKRTLIKTLLMDQKSITGIGNSYSDEILYHSGISPFSIAKAIPEQHARELYKSISKVLHTAIEKIDKENGNELKGELRDFMKIHGASIKKGPKGEEILSEKIGGRKTYYTKGQELFE